MPPMEDINRIIKCVDKALHKGIMFQKNDGLKLESYNNVVGTHMY